MKKPSTEAVAAAARWWAERLTAPTFDNLGPTRGRDPHETRINDFSSIMASNLAHLKGAPSSDVLTKFERELISVIEKADYFPGSLYCDYGPDMLLAEAARKAGIPVSRFPWKSGTWFDREDRVWAATGYGAPRRQIYGG